MTKEVKENNIPVHLGLILDGNRRWARTNGLPQLEGHRRGYQNLKTIAQAAVERGVEYVSAYVFSTENWKRSEEEVKYLVDMLIWAAKNEASELKEKNLRMRIMGSREGLSSKVISAIEDIEASTAENTGGTLLACFNYGGQQEIVDAAKKMLLEGVEPSQITAESFEQFLYAPDVPPADLIIRTSGEHRLSNFQLWRAAYSEFIFTDKHWPDFSVADLDVALAEYADRARRFGG